VARKVTDFGVTAVLVADGNVHVLWLLQGATWPE
jgi:hypothetical protein